ncbi:MAG: YidC/Oxa1 family membrane protein insertase [Lachnospiraceae bacterium]|nr:YidC/Oxa1 family membrane protein insertase [Lachnospiraceae bacterium]MBR5179874.1 YidC/Oxa1 family membrane protein insertase [Lachnospiraceae bacterium]
MVFLTQVQGVLKPIAWVLGNILNAIYNFVELFGIENIALCIVLFTFVVKMLMLPLTIKQQKFTKLQSKMSPELTKIQQKYKGKKDEESLRRQQSETQAVYAKYGASPMGGCLPLLISLPIMFALYRVIYCIPAYVTDVGSLYGSIADKLQEISGYKNTLMDFMTQNSLVLSQQSGCSSTVIDLSIYQDVPREYLIDLFSKFNPANWDAFFSVDLFSSIKTAAVTINEATMPVSEVVDKIVSVNGLFGLSILDRPEIKSISVVIPVLAVVTQFIQGKLQTAVNSNKNKAADDPAQQTTKMMSTIMPIMSGAFCLMLPIGVGIYWIASAVFTIIQTLFINKYLDKVNVDEMLEKSKEKNIKRQEKLGVSYDNKMAEVAKTKGLNYNNSSADDYDNTSYKKNSNKKSKQTGSDYKRSNVSYSSKSIAANANLLSNRSSAKKEVKNEDTVNSDSNDKSES